MKGKSWKFPEYISVGRKGDKQNQDTNVQSLHLISQNPNSNSNSNSTIFRRSILSICDILGCFANGFILIHHQNAFYMIDQHAASQKSLFLQYLSNPIKKYTKESNEYIYLPNTYLQTLEDHEGFINSAGWQFEIIEKRASQTVIKLTQVPLFFQKQLGQDDFCFLVDKIYTQQSNQQYSQEYSQSEKSSMASFACHNAIKVGDKLQKQQMRGLIDSLSRMDAPFNCPHMRPIIISLGNIKKYTQSIKIEKQYSFD